MNRRQVLKGLLAVPFMSLVPKVEPDIFKGIRETRPIRTKMYELYVSPEAWEDIRNWNVHKIDEEIRDKIFINNGLS